MPSHEKQTEHESGTDLEEVKDTVRDIFAYPVATPSAAATETPAPSAAATPGSVGRQAEDTIRQALGWRYRPTDVKGFQSALTRSFTLVEDEEGNVEWKWTPQTYAVQADLGEITGAQASILEQARVTINYVLPLVDGLKPLRVDSDHEDVHAITTLVRTKFSAILAELGRVGGPRVQRVDLAFEELLGIPIMRFTPPGGGEKGGWAPVPIKDSDDWREQLEDLEDGRDDDKVPYSLLYQLTQEFGLLPGLANTVEEERNLTNALIIVDSAIALRTSWIGKRPYFDRNNIKNRYLGTQLVWISRQLEVVAESVRDAYQAMDSVYFGPQEREATDIHFIVRPRGGARADEAQVVEIDEESENPEELKDAPITVGDLLDWVYTFATQEGPQLLQDAGKDGVLAFRSTVSRLVEWVDAARKFSQRGRGPAPRSFFTARVELALREIEHQLEITLSRARGITRQTRPPAQDGAEIANLARPPDARVESIGKPPRNGRKAPDSRSNAPELASTGMTGPASPPSKPKSGSSTREESEVSTSVVTGAVTPTATPITAPGATPKSGPPESRGGSTPRKS